MTRGRKKLSPYAKYKNDFNKAKKRYKSSWDDPIMLSKKEFELASQNYDGSRDEVINEIIHQQKWGYGKTEALGRKEFFDLELKGKAKWTDVRGMTHDQFVDAFNNEISYLYNTLKSDSDLGWNGASKLISSYIFGSN